MLKHWAILKCSSGTKNEATFWKHDSTENSEEPLLSSCAAQIPHVQKGWHAGLALCTPEKNVLHARRPVFLRGWLRVSGTADRKTWSSTTLLSGRALAPS
ncbi:MAG: hypothetical protein ACK4UN_17970, partial [Limisphaerales bacterium]